MALKEDVQELQNTLTAVREEIANLRAVSIDIDARMRKMEVAAPAELRALSMDAVKSAIEDDPYVRFEVLADWRGQLVKGAILRADHVPYVADYVGAGLMVGVPRDNTEYVAELRGQAEARTAAAKAMVDEAEASAIAAQAAAAEVRARMEAERHPPIDAAVQEQADKLRGA